MQQINNIGLLPPQAIELEEAILGACMLEQDAILEISNILRAEMFYKDSHQKIFQAVYDLSNNFKPIDILTVTNLLRDKGILDEVGGSFYITTLTSRVASSTNIENHALIVLQKYMARESIRVGNEIVKQSYDMSNDINDVIDFAYQSIDKINDSTLHGRVKTFAENLEDSINEYEQRVKAKKEGKQISITTGLSYLNRILIGWRKGNLIILAARPSVGKSALALYFAKRAGMAGNYVDIFSLEMTKTEISDRILLSETTINPTLYQSGIDVDRNEIDRSDYKLRQMNISINDEMDININYIRSIIRKKYKQKKLGLVIVDYLQLMEGSDKSNKNNEIGSITRSLKKLAVKYEFPLILLSQLSRDLEKRGSKKHKLSDLRDSGNIEQDADIVLFLTRERFDAEGNDLDYSNEENRQVLIDIAKHRNGSLGTVQIYCNEFVNNFYEHSNQQEPIKYFNETNEQPF
jgi:replicative DNA helicase